MAEAFSVLLRLLVISTIVERFLEIASLIWDYLDQSQGRERAPAGRKRVVLQSAGVVLGSALSLFMGVTVFRMLGIGGIPYLLDVFFTGILVGGGTEPVHSLIKFLEEHKDRVRKDLEEARGRLGEPETVAPDGESLGVAYNGGLYPERAGHGLRTRNPELIVYHHSATHSSASFERIVEIEKERDLDPTYHCVVTADGAYHNYCRWDSIGWHAKGANSRSLGICLVGNFHLNPDDSLNNADGRFGNQVPTDAQLDTAARVVALWMILYDIAPEGIVPHRAVRDTTCPGDNFPGERLVDLARSYRERWSTSAEVAAEIEELKQKPGVYV